MAIVNMQVTARDAVKSYGVRRDPKRIRLTASERGLVHYVLSEWSGEAGCSSNFGSMIRAIADKAPPDEVVCVKHAGDRPESPEKRAPRKEWEAYGRACDAFWLAVQLCRACSGMPAPRSNRRSIARNGKRSPPRMLCRKHEEARPNKSASRVAKRVFENTIGECAECLAPPMTAAPHAQVNVFDVEGMTATERWSDQRKFTRPTQPMDREVGFEHKRWLWREGVLRCWRTLHAMAHGRNPSLVILNALYGDLPPGLPHAGIWDDKDLDREYRRVVRYVDGSGGTGAALEALLLVEHHKLPDEAPEAHRERVLAAAVARKARIDKLGAGCETLIVAAAGAYRQTWRATP